jgi:hypothetical protein
LSNFPRKYIVISDYVVFLLNFKKFDKLGV